MIPTPGQNLNEVESYRLKLFEKFILKRLKPILEKRKLIPFY